jgi:hypothetical protein
MEIKIIPGWNAHHDTKTNEILIGVDSDDRLLSLLHEIGHAVNNHTGNQVVKIGGIIIQYVEPLKVLQHEAQAWRFAFSALKVIGLDTPLRRRLIAQSMKSYVFPIAAQLKQLKRMRFNKKD